MEIQAIQDQPSERGTAIVTVAPTDENGDALTFAQLKNPQWKMMIDGGDVVPGCEFGENSITSLTWVIKGAQLAIFGSTDRGRRRLCFEAKYDSDAGFDLPVTDECMFKIKHLQCQPDEDAL